MKEAAIFLGGEDYRGELEIVGKLIILCDSAVRFAEKRGISADVILGDFDSLGYIPEKAEVFPKEKNETDFELALDYLAEKGIKKAVVYCGGGGRDDHFLGNVFTLSGAFDKGIDILFVTNYCKMRAFEKEAFSQLKKGTTVSLIPIGGACVVKSSDGFKYPLENLTLTQVNSRGISNLTSKDEQSLIIEKGRLLFIEVTDELSR